MQPARPEAESPYRYRYYLHSERGRDALTVDRNAFYRLLWEQWSPTWSFSQEAFRQSSASFENADFVDVVIHSYRHRFGLAGVDPAYEQTKAKLANLPPIGVPTIAVDGGDDGLTRTGTRSHAGQFIGSYHYRKIDGAGHNLPQEVPGKLAKLVLELRMRTSSLVCGYGFS